MVYGFVMCSSTNYKCIEDSQVGTVNGFVVGIREQASTIMSVLSTTWLMYIGCMFDLFAL